MTQPAKQTPSTSKWPAGVLGRSSLAVVVGLLSLVGCTSDEISVDPGPDPLPIGGDAGTNVDGSTACVRPEEGCACDPGTESMDCYLDPITIEGRTTCRSGTRYCRAGLWTACESLVDYELGGSGGAALLTGPTACNPCDPRCFGYVDRPGPGDLTSGNSSNVSYDTVGGGISLTPTMPVSPPLTDTDGDGIPDVADSCVGPGAFVAADGSCYGDTFFYHLLPYGGPAVIDPLNIQVQIRTADIYFLMDTTGSMGGELARLRTDLTTGNFLPSDPTCGNGVVGAIRCAIPDAWFGVGYFDDYPVNPFGGAGTDLVYRNVLDISNSLAAAQTAINTLAIHWGNDGPESNTQALWAVASGGALGPYLNSRGGCPAGTWGYPCFRNGTIPVIIHVTDAPFHNGPAGAYPYTGLTWPGFTGVTGNENIASAFAVGNVPGWAQYSGTTSGMTNDYNDAACTSTGAPDAVFSFRVPGPGSQTVTLSTDGSSYDTVVSLYRRDTPVPVAVTGNESFATARTIASPTGAPQVFTGNTSTMANDFADGCSGGAADAMYQFTLGSSSTVALDTGGSSFDTTLSLWRVRAVDAAVSGNESITSSPYDVGSINGSTVRSYSGSTAAMANDHPTSCTSGTARDAAFRFTLGSAATINIDTEGSSYDTVLSLFQRGGTAVTGNDSPANPQVATSAVGTNATFTGSTAGMINHNSSSCGGGSFGDAVYRFDLTATTTLDVDTIGSSFDTVLSLYRYTPAAAPVAVTGNDTSATARDLGTLGAGYHAVFTGTTSGMTHNVGNGCDSGTSGSAPDSLFRFTLTTARTVTMDLTGTAFDSVVTLYNSTLGEVACDNNSAPDDGLLVRNLGAGTYYVAVDGRRTSEVGAYTLRIAADEMTAVACDDNGGGGTASSLVTSLTAGTYLLAVDGAAEGSYTLNFGNGSYTAVACDNDGIAAGGASRINQALAAGEYFAIVDGAGTASGNYRINFGTGGLLSQVSCNDDAGGALGNRSQIISTLAAGTYYVGVDGYGSATGAYQLNVGSSTSATNIACNDDGSAPPYSRLVQTLTPGDYYAVVDGRGTASGNYRLSLGIAPPAVPEPLSPVTFGETIAALNARDVRVITFQTCGFPGDWYCDEGTAHANALAAGTNSVDGTGAPYTFLGSGTGAGLSTAVVNAVVNLANYSRMDITARPVGDTAGFTITPISAVSWGPLGSCTSISGGSTFVGCLPGTQVNFNVQFRNTTVMPTTVPQVFDFFIEVVGDSSIILERIPVRIVVPAEVPSYPATGYYTRDYDSTARCAINERPIWGALRWNVPSLPTGTSVRFELRTADTAAALPTATPMATVPVPAVGAGTADITTVLASAGALSRQYFLRVNAVLNASPDRARAPVLSEVQVAYTCIPDE